MNPESSAMLRLVGVAFLIFFIAFMILSGPFWWREYKILSAWREVEAKVVSSDVIPVSVRGKSGYDAQVIFQYNVGDATLTTTYRSNRPSQKAEDKQQFASKFIPGDRMKILYNPTYPANIRVHPGYNLKFFATPSLISGFALMCMIAGLALLIFSRRAAKRTA